MSDGERKKKIVITGLLLILCGVLYTCFVKLTGLGIPCLFYQLTGWQCPGCGISRMLLGLLAGDIAGAYSANPFLLLTSPFLLFELGFNLYLQWNAETMPRWNSILLWLYIAALILFGAYRNLYGIN